jgi:hypothetical protein
MEKQIVRWSYLLGVACVVVAVLWRLAGTFGMAGQIHLSAGEIGYGSFLKAAFLLLLLTVATSSYAAAMKE